MGLSGITVSRAEDILIYDGEKFISMNDYEISPLSNDIKTPYNNIMVARTSNSVNRLGDSLFCTEPGKYIGYYRTFLSNQRYMLRTMDADTVPDHLERYFTIHFIVTNPLHNVTHTLGEITVDGDDFYYKGLDIYNNYIRIKINGLDPVNPSSCDYDIPITTKWVVQDTVITHTQILKFRITYIPPYTPPIEI